VTGEPRHDAARPGDLRRSVLDASRIERERGWRPEVDLEEGLRRTWAWMQEAQAP
jgi:UDP-glucose 4-epimerase